MEAIPAVRLTHAHGIHDRNLKIRDQILLVTLPPLFVLLCAVALFFYAYVGVTIIRNVWPCAARRAWYAVKSFLRHATEASMAVREFASTRRARFHCAYDRAVTDGLADLMVLSDMEIDNPGQLPEITRIRAEFDQLQKEWALPVIEKTRSGVPFDVNAALTDGQVRLAQIRSQVSKSRQEDETENAAEMMIAERVIRHMLFVGVSLAVLLAVLLVILTRVVTRMIVVPVLQLIRASEQVAQGDFALVLSPMVDNEFGVLSRSFSNMTSALRREREEIASLNRFSEAVTQCTSELEVYDLLLHSLRARFQPKQLIIFKLNASENFLEAAATLTPLPQEAGAWPVIEEPHNCKAVRTGRSFVVNDVTGASRCAPRNSCSPRRAVTTAAP